MQRNFECAKLDERDRERERENTELLEPSSWVREMAKSSNLIVDRTTCFHKYHLIGNQIFTHT